LSDPKRLIEDGYNAIADRFGVWRAGISGSPEEEWLSDLLARLPKQAAILELGCGQGAAARRIVDAGHQCVGVDISVEQLRRARQLVPEADFQHGDFTQTEFDPSSLDAVVALYVFNHLARADLAKLLERIPLWLRPGGWLLATFGKSGTEGVQSDWLGVPMFFGSYTERETLDLLRDSEFALIRHAIVGIVEPDEGPAEFLWVLAHV
jgi:cyclopropane fatty-acyl-phospholipid synthase-like methyltransferase